MLFYLCMYYLFLFCNLMLLSNFYVSEDLILLFLIMSLFLNVGFFFMMFIINELLFFCDILFLCLNFLVVFLSMKGMGDFGCLSIKDSELVLM